MSQWAEAVWFTPMDLMKFGYLIASHGRLEKRQLIPADYITMAVSNLTATNVTGPVPSESCGYGYQFWRNEQNGYTCYGMGGQLIIVLPDYDFICVTTADTQGIGGGNQLIYDALFEEVLPFIAPALFPHNPTSRRAKGTSDTIVYRTLKGLSASAYDRKISGTHYRIAENPMGFTDFAIVFDPNGKSGELSFTLKDQHCVLPFGIGHLEENVFPIYQQHCATSGIWQDERTFYIKSHIIDAYVGSVHLQCAFGDEDITIFMKKQKESLFREFNGHLYGTISFCR